MLDLASRILPELILITVACLLFLVGVSDRAFSRRLAPLIALLALVAVFAFQLWGMADPAAARVGADSTHEVVVGAFSDYVKLIVSGVGVLLVLLAWPTNDDATGSASLLYGHEAGEFFGLMLLSLSGVLLVADANDIILLFLGIELASIPTYIMVSISRPLPVAQEAGVKYFFLGAMAAALMLFGFSYLYGTTGVTRLDQISGLLHPATLDPWSPAALTTWHKLAVVMLLGGFAFKIAAVPLHAYAGDVYQGAATPVTAFLAFVPKTSGFIAIIKLLIAVGGVHFTVPPVVVTLLWVVAALTMSIGNVLGLIQTNVKRVLAYSSVAHSGYMLVGLTALMKASESLSHSAATQVHEQAIGGVLFYLAAYGIMNAGAFGVLALLPSRGADAGLYATPRTAPAPATSAETYDDLAGQGTKHLGLGLAMAVCCFSLIGLPLTVGFFGKVYLIKPALDSGLIWLVGITMLNAAVSAAYYLKIIATMFLRPLPEADTSRIRVVDAGTTPATPAAPTFFPTPILAAVVLSVVGTLVFGTILPATSTLTDEARTAAAAASGPPPPRSPRRPPDKPQRTIYPPRRAVQVTAAVILSGRA